jgi:hypothetical protein
LYSFDRVTERAGVRASVEDHGEWTYTLNAVPDIGKFGRMAC